MVTSPPRLPTALRGASRSGSTFSCPFVARVVGAWRRCCSRSKSGISRGRKTQKQRRRLRLHGEKGEGSSDSGEREPEEGRQRKRKRGEGNNSPFPFLSFGLLHPFLPTSVADRSRVSALGERLKIGGAEVSRKMKDGVSSMSFKMKELFQGQNQAEKIVEEATSENLEGPDWSANLEICDMINSEKYNSIEFIRGIKKRIMLKNPRVQYLALVLLETCVKNCEKAFSEVAAERVLDEMVKLIDDPQTIVNNRNKALYMIEAWGESGDELRYLPVYEETYKSLKSRGVQFPGRDNESLAPIFTPPGSVSETEEAYDNVAQQTYDDTPVHSFTAEQIKETFDVARNSIELLSTVLSSSPHQEALQDDLTKTLFQQCQQSQYTVQRIVETAGDDEAVLFEALNVNDELQKVLSKYEELKKPPVVQSEPVPAMIPVAVEPDESPRASREDALIRKPAGSRTNPGGEDDILNDLDEMIFGKKDGSTSEDQDPKKKRQEKKGDLITF
ncbi:VHS and GAT domain containing protein [Musa troglodytarum]|uniref:VHS and GAT domain containing protein n=1 Tax=Musa troglodytarum TaxID=320322 RepID=A0A9E7F8N4_9LILI|nr:VHS and GAT domain containing protein [Musa troglodytarum]